MESQIDKQTGVKHDSGKAKVSLIPTRAIIEEAKVMGFGEVKYGSHNWRNGIAWSRVLDAILRHLLAYKEGEDLDPETGISHIAHARCGTAFLLEYEISHKELDDRPKKEKLAF